MVVASRKYVGGKQHCRNAGEDGTTDEEKMRRQEDEQLRGRSSPKSLFERLYEAPHFV